MDQYEQTDDEPSAVKQDRGQLQAVVQPHTIELKWDNKVLRVPNPDHVRQLTATCDQLRVDLQELKDKYHRMQSNNAQLLKMIQQIQNQLSG